MVALTSLSDEEKGRIHSTAATSYLLHPGRRRSSRAGESDEESTDEEDSESSRSEGSDDEQEKTSRQPEDHARTRQIERWLIACVVLMVVLGITWWGMRYIDSNVGEGGGSSTVSANPTSAMTDEGTTAAPATPKTSPTTSASKPVATSAATSITAESAERDETANTASQSQSAPSASASASSSGASGSGQGLFGVTDDVCGDSGAVEEPGPGVGPNGAQTWLNCGLSSDDKSAKWTPPHIDIASLKALDLSEAVKLDTFKACEKWVDLFNSVGASTNLPPIFLASIALTESSCESSAVAPGGASWGLMQITTEKCGGAPNGDCTDPEFNVKAGADYFNTVMKDNDGSFLLALGQYNGWPPDMSWSDATAFASTDCVRQNNLDYLQSNLNGWMQGVDGNSVRTINNLDSC